MQNIILSNEQHRQFSEEDMEDRYVYSNRFVKYLKFYTKLKAVEIV